MRPVCWLDVVEYMHMLMTITSILFQITGELVILLYTIYFLENVDYFYFLSSCMHDFLCFCCNERFSEILSHLNDGMFPISSSDGETFISADDLRINLWNLEISNQSFNIVDVKPTNMEDLTGKLSLLYFYVLQNLLLSITLYNNFFI
jgi:hypothetical protein